MAVRGWYLRLATCAAGFAAMMLELLCVRLFAPYFGAGLNTWSSLIAATLLYLSLGYARGGRMVDENPSVAPLPRTLFVAALATLAIPFAFFLVNFFPLLFIPLFFLPLFVAWHLQPLLLAFILLYYPMTRLGQVVPLCVGLVAHESKGIGRAAGNIYALSTIGGLAGTLATGYILIPLLSTQLLLVFLAVALLMIAYLGSRLHRAGLRPTRLQVFLLTVGIVLGTAKNLEALGEALGIGFVGPPPEVLARTNSFYGRIDVVESGDRRYMLIDQILQTSMPTSEGFFREKGAALRERYFFELLPYFNPRAQTALVIGLGGGVLDKIFRTYDITAQFVEIDPKVVRLAREYFGFTGKVVLDDGRRFVRRTREKFDLIVLDAYSADVLPFHLFTREAFRDMRDRLTDDGILAVNLISFPRKSVVTASVWQTVNDAFPHVVAYRSATAHADDPQCIFLFASNAPLSPDFSQLPEEKGAELDELARRYRLKIDDTPGIVLTDAYCPLDRAWSAVAAQWRFRNASVTSIPTMGMIWYNSFRSRHVWGPRFKVAEGFKKIRESLYAFAMNAGRPPNTEEGLMALIRRDRPIGMMTAASDFSYLRGEVSNLHDPFSPDKETLYRYAWQPCNRWAHWHFIVVSNGPDGEPDFDEKAFCPYRKDDRPSAVPNEPNFGLPRPLVDYFYDPTNGELSPGDIVLVGQAHDLGITQPEW